MTVPLLLCVLLAQEYYEPVTKFKRELGALTTSRAEVAAKIQETADAIAKDSPGFYKAHEADCEVTGKKPDGTVKYVYIPGRAWIAQRKRFDEAIKAKEVDLLEALDAAIALLLEHEKRLQKRREVWETALKKLDKESTDLNELEAEWRRASILSAWNFVLEIVPILGKGLESCGVRLKRPPPGSIFSKYSYEERDKLERKIQRVMTSSSLALHAVQEMIAAGDASKAKEAKEQSAKTMDAVSEAIEGVGDLLKLAAVGTTKAELEEMEHLGAGLSAFVGIMKAAVAVSDGGFDEKSRELLKDAAVRGIKFAGEFNPAIKSVTMAYGGIMATAEAWTAGSAWWSIHGNVKEHRKNLEKATSTLDALRKELATVSARLAEYRQERELLGKKLGK